MSDERDDEVAITTKEGGAVSCFGRGRCCRNNPGWFGPGEIEQTAAYLGMEPAALFRTHLVVVSTPATDVPGEPMMDIFAPVKVDEAGAPLVATGARVPRAYQFMSGPCVFYQHERCAIHPARPIECRRYFCEQPDELNLSRPALARMWWEAAQP